MTTRRLPSGNTPFQNAFSWIGRELKNDPTRTAFGLINEAGFKFGLSPIETQTLVSWYQKESEQPK